ncbi:LysM peptidoglycan-binding domain-containing protein [Rothia sp. AR01]|uniref:LysM peptidoglycan-binding domain-containing protein n=1 Tax=Rothia santali TaxID=2949643 RepID=A0A9X2HEB6_9MICC|nr:LysM peptidoglycan-binding domain-containing protein [Rothia santali]MCP3425252.1 LysM peptidoglycan-binding domain-containing protein [Rothia santali]
MSQTLARTGAMVPGSPDGAPRLTLTRRGRFVFIGLPVLLTATAVLAALLVFLASGTANATSEPTAQVTEQIVVSDGDTLWAIAGEVDPGADPRETVALIGELNELPGGSLEPGQRLVVPVISEG